MTAKYPGFYKPRFTQTPNDFFDELLPAIETKAELKVTLAIIRQTLGYHKDGDCISLTQLEQMTGLSRNSVIAGARAAVARGTIQTATDTHPSTIITHYRLAFRQCKKPTASAKTEPVLVQKLNTQNKEIKHTFSTRVEKGPEPKPISEHFEDVMEFLRKTDGRNKAIAATAEFCALCFGGRPEYGRIGRIGKMQKHRYRRICQAALESVAKSPRGDPYSYLEACLKGGGRDAKEKQGVQSRGGPAHRVADREEFEKAKREVQERKAAEAGG